MSDNGFKVKNKINIKPGGETLDAEGDIAFNSTSHKLEVRDNSATRSMVSEDGTQTLTNKSISGATNTLSSIPSSAVNTGAATTLDLATSNTDSTINIGSGTGANVVNIGGANTTVNITGSVNNQAVTNLNVTDKLITINDGGAAASGGSAGIEVEENGSATAYVQTSTDRNAWKFKAPNQNGVITMTATSSNDDVVLEDATQVLTNKTISSSSNTVDATKLQTKDIATTAPSDGQYLKYVASTSKWTPSNIGTASPPTIQRFTSGSGTYTKPAGVTYIRVRMIGAGAGGYSSANANQGADGGDSTFGSSLLTAGGGKSTPSGGTNTINSPAIIIVNVDGGTGIREQQIAYATGGIGGISFFGGSPTGGVATGGPGGNAPANSGAGGGGGSSTGGNASGSGGGAGGYLEAQINSPSATYSYAVGAGGTGGSGSGNAGGNGGSGVIIVEEFYT